MTGAVVSRSNRFFDHRTFEELQCEQSQLTRPGCCLPSGFLQAAFALNSELLVAMSEIDALSSLVQRSRLANEVILSATEVDNIQASIESRLYNLRTRPIASSSIVMSCSLAAHICCYLVSTEIWSSTFIPTQLSLQLSHVLPRTISEPVWEDNVDLILWIIFVGGAFAEDPKLKSKYVTMVLTTALNGSWRSSWEDTKEILRTFIWLEVFEAPFQRLWEDMSVSSSFLAYLH